MIWQLVWRDPRWRGGMAFSAVVAAAVAALAAFLPVPSREPTRYAFGTGLGFALSFEMGLLAFLLANLHTSRDWYEAALPIAGRDLWGSRVLSLLTVIWVTALVGILCGLPPFPLVDAAAIYTVVILGLKCFRIGEIGLSKAARAAIVYVLFVAIVFVTFFGKRLAAAHWFPPPVWSVVLVCGLASAALFLWGWINVPQSFQIAPAELVAVPSREMRRQSRSVWMPVFESVYTSPEMPGLFIFVVGVLFHGDIGSVGIVASIALFGVRRNCRWLLAFPVSRRRLFALIAAAPAVATLFGCLAAAFFSSKYVVTGREGLVEFGVEVAAVYLTIFLSELPAWRPLRRLRAWVRWIPYALSGVAAPVVLSDIGDVRKVAAFLPATWWQLVGVLLLPVIASYWLAEKAFIGQEYYRPFAGSLSSRRS